MREPSKPLGIAFPCRVSWVVCLATVALLTACAHTSSGQARDGGEDSERRQQPGLLDLELDDNGGKVFITLPAPHGRDDAPAGEVGRYLYLEGIATGLGHNDVGLDRGQIGEARLISVRRQGKRVFFEQPNLRFRAPSGNLAAERATRESFATSVLWAGTVESVDASGQAKLEITSFLLRDAHGVATTLGNSGQGNFSLDLNRSLVDTTACLAFPDNLEFEALLTFGADAPGGLVQATAPTANSVSLVQHLSLVRLPDDGYTPRVHDPRAGWNALSFQDTTAALTDAVRTQWATRHRLKAVDPSASRSRVEEPIIYYVDRGAPEQVRGALLEGASWWAEAFDAAGFVDAYEVRLLPEDAHPLDVRFNVIQWVHRSTRGWSYGNSIIDPRTGEIIKGHVTLGSLRIRQDRLLFEGLLGTAHSGDGSVHDPVQLALMRIRQLAAHEVGHTLGFAHNFAASTVFNGSVMDYPAPNVDLDGQGGLDLSMVYGVGLGPWDKRSLFWLYSEVDAGSPEEAFLSELIGVSQSEIPFLSDGDARAASAAHPQANLWDNGADSVEQLLKSLAVRRWALDRFDATRLADGRPLAELEELLATVYFHHRFQVDAAAKSVGGIEYTHALNDGELHAVKSVAGEQQRAAVAALLSALRPEALDLAESTLSLLHPRPPGSPHNREQFASSTSPAFDALGAAASAARQVLNALLQPARCARLVDQHRRDGDLPDLRWLTDTLMDSAFGSSASSPRLRAVQAVVQSVLVDELMGLAADPRATAWVRGDAESALSTLSARLESLPEQAALRRSIERFLSRPATADPAVRPASPLPPGSPIGSDLGACSLPMHD